MTIGLFFIALMLLLSTGCFIYAGKQSSEGSAWLGVFLIIFVGLAIGIRSDSLDREKALSLCIKEGKDFTQVLGKKVCILE